MLYEGAGNDREDISLVQSIRARGWSTGLFALLFLSLALFLGLKAASRLSFLFFVWFCSNLAFASLIPALKRRLRSSRLLQASLGLDAPLAATAAWFAGGAEWLGFVAVFFLVIFSAVYLKPSAARRMIILCCLTFMAYVAIVTAGILPTQSIVAPSFLGSAWELRAASAAIFASMFGALSFTVDRVMSRQFHRQRSLQAANDRLHSLNEQLHDKQFSLLCSQQDLMLMNEKLRQKSEEVLRSQDVLKALAVAVEAKDSYTEGHSSRVAGFAVQLAKALGMRKEELEILRDGCYLHDIGKVNVSDLILHKPSTLSDDEYGQMKRHPLIGEQICQPLAFARPWLDIIRHHHERIDGRGYPDGLAGSEISLNARVAAIADAWDAMTSDRPYRKAMPAEKAVRILREGKDSQWDGELVEIFIEAVGAREGALHA